MRRRQSSRVVLIGRNILLREGISRILHAADFHIAISVSSTDELPNGLQAHPLLFVIVHHTDEFELAVKHIGFVREHYPDARVTIVSDHCRPHELISAYRAGACGYFVDVNSCDTFTKSMELVAMGETVFPPAFLSFVLDGAPDRESQLQLPTGDERSNLIEAAEERIAPHLSPRERAILSFLIEGSSNKSIARKIDIAEATVKVHVKAILRKIRVQNRTQAAIWGMNNGSLVRPSNGHALALSIDRATAPSLAIQERERHEVDVSEVD